VILVNELFQSTNIHWKSSKLLNFFQLFIIFFTFCTLLVTMKLNQLFFHQQIIFYTLKFQLTETTFCDWCDCWELDCALYSFVFFLTTYSWWWWDRLFLRLVFFLLLVAVTAAHLVTHF